MSEPEAGSGPQPVYAGVEDWVTNHLAHVYRRQAGKRWCARWWDHAEAVSRLEALWRAWESLRLDGQSGMSVWWRDHADYHLPVLLDPTGPFARCGPDEHVQSPGLPCEPAPAGWWRHDLADLESM